ncbi:hypothetical protein [Ovoidimarina sediminis]|uniref:hypothetical protein n=1 Tax=Ovoidimarina sediminis TaxID=3079856 RepID=UPI0029095869|nr:hypothetical protein [Rhodophyticola sp. MJ-SS7]MDU8943482.1 hypothetical protein [Rhodophyticola sp. MJ-SS7]
MRAILLAALFTVLAHQTAAEELWEKLETFIIDRFEISLPSGPAWNPRSGNQWYNLSRRIRTQDGDFFLWIGFEVNYYPANRYDWTAAEIARDVRDVEALKLLEEEAKTGNQLAVLEYKQGLHAGQIAYSLLWAHRVYIESLERNVPAYQELYVFLPADHYVDLRYMAIYFGAYCVSSCKHKFPSVNLLHPVLETVKISDH